MENLKVQIISVEVAFDAALQRLDEQSRAMACQSKKDVVAGETDIDTRNNLDAFDAAEEIHGRVQESSGKNQTWGLDMTPVPAPDRQVNIFLSPAMMVTLVALPLALKLALSLNKDLVSKVQASLSNVLNDV